MSELNRQRMTEKSLAEQLHITDRDIEYRKKLLKFTDEDVKYLVDSKETVVENLAEIVNRFYDMQRGVPEIELLIGDVETFRRLHASMEKYIIELFEGYYDREYVNKRLRIGKVHKRIGVSPKLYVSAITYLESLLYEYLLDVGKKEKNCDICSGRNSALNKLLMFDIQLVFDTYINSLLAEVKMAKEQVEEYAEGLEEVVELRTRQLEELSRRDELTGLYNQRAFYDELRREVSRAERTKVPIVLLYMDLNNFKKLNDTEGHMAGDAILSAVGSAILQSVRSIDIPCRYGGDEFAVIMPDTDVKQAETMYTRLVGNFNSGDGKGISFSVGVAGMGTSDYFNSDTIVKAADKEMYKAKTFSRKKPGHHISVIHL